jgi:hypothetical protein
LIESQSIGFAFIHRDNLEIVSGALEQESLVHLSG